MLAIIGSVLECFMLYLIVTLTGGCVRLVLRGSVSAAEEDGSLLEEIPSCL